VAGAHDNSMAESFVSTQKREVDPPPLLADPSERQGSDLFEFIEAFYNTRRRYSAQKHLSSAEYEEVRMKGEAVA
jgi:putative transposase